MTGSIPPRRPRPDPTSEPAEQPEQPEKAVPSEASEQPPHPPPANDPLAFLTSAPLGTRVVARTRIPGGFSDALGYLRERDGAGCTIEARRGPVTVVFADLVAAKEVPPPPERRAPRRQGSAADTGPTES